MSRSGQVAIFWDYENCHPPTGVPGYVVADMILSVARNYGSVNLFKAYLELSAQSFGAKAPTLHSELQCSGVSLTHCPHNGRKDVADKMMLVDMIAYAIDHAPPATIVIISGDRDFTYGVSVLRLRGYHVISISPVQGHSSLKLRATDFFSWEDLVHGRLSSSTQSQEQPVVSHCVITTQETLTVSRQEPLLPVADKMFANKGQADTIFTLVRSAPISIFSPVRDCPSESENCDYDSPWNTYEQPLKEAQVTLLDAAVSENSMRRRQSLASDDSTLLDDQEVIAASLLTGDIDTGVPESYAQITRDRETQWCSTSLEFMPRFGECPFGDLGKAHCEVETADLRELSTTFVTPCICHQIPGEICGQQHGNVVEVEEENRTEYIASCIPSSSPAMPPTPSIVTAEQICDSYGSEKTSKEIILPTKPTMSHSVPGGAFAVLIEVLLDQRANGITQPRWSQVGEALMRRDSQAYKHAGVSKLKPYMQLAQQLKVVRLGGVTNPGYEWVQLETGSCSEPIFLPLVYTMSSMETRGRHRCTRSALEKRLVKCFPSLYKRAKTSSFGMYLSKAEQAKLVTFGKGEQPGTDWVELRKE